MGRVVLFSFLGTGNYDDLHYEIQNNKKVHSKFAQVAVYEQLRDIHAEIEMYIFLTNSAREKNWNSGRSDAKIKPYIGLRDILNKQYPNLKKHDIPIPETQDQPANWQLFDTILSVIQKNDTVYFDMTHGFRSIPFVSFIVLQYARYLKEITFGGLFYGITDESDKTSGKIIDFTEMMELIDWTEGINQFVRTGNPSIITEQVKKEKRQIFQKEKLNKAEVSLLHELGKIATKMNNVNESFETVRGKTIVKEIDTLFRMINELSDVESKYLKALIPLLEKVGEKLALYHAGKAEQAKFVVDWCIMHGLIQQGYTFLQEFIISAFCDKLELDRFNHLDRRTVNSAIMIAQRNIPKSNWKVGLNEKEKIKQFIKDFEKYRSYLNAFSELTETRNDINHAGKRKNATNASAILKKLNRLKTELFPLIDLLYNE